MNLIQQLAKYQNAPVETLKAAKNGAFPTISPWVAGAILEDRIDEEKDMQLAAGAAHGPQPTVDEQQNQELAGIMQAMAPQGAGQAQAAPQEPVMAAEGGLMSADVDPSIYDYCGGGIIAFSGEERSDVPKAESKSAEEKQREDDQATLAKLWETIKSANRDAGAAIADVATLPLRGLAGAYDTAVVRPMRAAGIDAGYLSKHLVPEGVDPSSMTPFYDKYARGNAPKETPKETPKEDRKTSYRSAEENAKQDEYTRLVKQGMPPEMAAKVAGMSSAAAPASAPKAPPAGAKPAPSAGASKDSGIMAQLTSSPEWADLDAARKRQFEAPKLPTTAGEQAAERAAHLKAQGITEMPWETIDKQTKALIEQLGQEDFARAAKREADKGRPAYSRIVANMGTGSFGQAGSAGVRANMKYQDEMDAEDQRIKELRYNQKLKLNELNAKAQELRYNEATGDVAAAQKNRKDIAELQRSFEKDKIAIAQGQAGIRERGLAAQLNADTQLKAAGMRQGAAAALTPKQIADIRDKANDNIQKDIDKNVRLQMEIRKNPAKRAQMVEDETNRLLAQLQGGTMPAPSAAGAGGKSSAGWGKAQVVK